MSYTRGARPVKHTAIKSWYEKHQYRDVSLTEYSKVWRNWLEFSEKNSIRGLDDFQYVDYTQGTSQTFDHFILRHAGNRQIIALVGEFQYHACASKHINFKNFEVIGHLDPDSHALIISVPFSDYGCQHPDFDRIMDLCTVMQIPVCLDLAYWGIAKNTHLDLAQYPTVEVVTSSLSKPFYTLENHRVGVRFTRQYMDDGISMLNEVNMQNKHSMSLGVHYMTHFSPDWNWQTFGDAYDSVCNDLGLFYTDTVIFGLGDEERHKEFNRGIPNNYRVCISNYLGDITE